MSCKASGTGTALESKGLMGMLESRTIPFFLKQPQALHRGAIPSPSEALSITHKLCSQHNAQLDVDKAC